MEEPSQSTPPERPESGDVKIEESSKNGDVKIEESSESGDVKIEESSESGDVKIEESSESGDVKIEESSESGDVKLEEMVGRDALAPVSHKSGHTEKSAVQNAPYNIVPPSSVGSNPNISSFNTVVSNGNTAANISNAMDMARQSDRTGGPRLLSENVSVQSSLRFDADNLITPTGCKQSIRIQSSEPDQLIELPVIQSFEIQNRVIERPEIIEVEKYRECVTIKEIIKEVPKRKIVEREKIIEVPEIRKVPRVVNVPKVVTQIYEVPKIEIKQVLVEVPKLETKYTEKFVEVEEIQWVERFVEVPKYVDEFRYVEKTQIVEVPIYRVRGVPKREVKTVEKIRPVPGPIEYRDIPVERVVFCPKPRPMVSVRERPVQQDIFVDTEIAVPVPGDIVEVPFEVPKYVDKIIPKYVPGKIVRRPVSVPVERIIEVPVAEPYEEIRVIRREKLVPKEVVKEVEIAEHVDEVVEVPRHVYIDGPRVIIRPKLIKLFHELPSEELQGDARITKKIQYLPPVYFDESKSSASPQMSPSVPTIFPRVPTSTDSVPKAPFSVPFISPHVPIQIPHRSLSSIPTMTMMPVAHDRRLPRFLVHSRPPKTRTPELPSQTQSPQRPVPMKSQSPQRPVPMESLSPRRPAPMKSQSSQRPVSIKSLSSQRPVPMKSQSPQRSVPMEFQTRRPEPHPAPFLPQPSSSHPFSAPKVKQEQTKRGKKGKRHFTTAPYLSLTPLPPSSFLPPGPM